MGSRITKRIDFSYLLVAVVAAFIAYSLYQLNSSWSDAARGIILFERAQRDQFIDAGLVAQAAHVHSDVKLASVLREETVIVAQRHVNGHAFEGAGVIIGLRGDDLAILTARHVINHPGRTIVVLPTKEARYARATIKDATDDLALVYVRATPGVRYTAAPIARDDLAHGQHVTVMGHPQGIEWVASAGIADPHIHETLIFCRTCNVGDSGAGAFDARGRLHGVIIRKYIITAPSTTQERMMTVTAFSTVRPDRIHAFLRTSGYKKA